MGTSLAVEQSDKAIFLESFLYYHGFICDLEGEELYTFGSRNCALVDSENSH